MTHGRHAIFRVTARVPEAHGRLVRVLRWRRGATCGAALVRDIETGQEWLVDPLDLDIVRFPKAGQGPRAPSGKEV